MKNLRVSPLYLLILFNLCKYRIIANQGGTSSSKTYSALWLLDDLAIVTNKGIDIEIDNNKRNFNPFPNKEKLHITVVSQTMPHLKGGAIKDFKSIKKDFKDSWDDKCWNKTDKLYTYPNGSVIEFKAMDEEGKARGARRDILFVNEINKGIKQSTYDQLAIRTDSKIIVDWNPSEPEHWIYNNIVNDERCKLIISTYLDNYDFLSKDIINDIERKKITDPVFWKVFGEGLRGNDGKGNVFSGWQQLSYNQFPVSNTIYGLDLGFTNDPTVLVEVRRYGDNIYIKELLYLKPTKYKSNFGSEFSTRDLIFELNNLKKQGLIQPNAIIYSDKAGFVINDLRQAGFNIYPAKKDRILEGIDFIKRYNVFVDLNSNNIWLEYNFYKYYEDKKSLESNTYLNNPMDIHNHAMDALRYACEEWRGLHSKSISKALS